MSTTAATAPEPADWLEGADGLGVPPAKERPAATDNGTETAVPHLPVNSLRDAVTELRRPFTPEAVKFKIQTNPKGDNGKAMIVAFIDARLVSERLNAVCPHLWSTEFEAVTGGMLCKLTIEGQTRGDAGHSQNTTTDIGLKALYSDAFKRAAVHFGVGASLYTLPRVYVAADRLKKVTRQDGKVLWFLPDAVERSLRNGYGKWLDMKGEREFGKALDHGDQELAQGDHEADASEPGPERVAEDEPGAHREGSDVPSAKQLDFIASLAKDLGADGGDQELLRAYAATNLTGGKEGSGSRAIEALKGDTGLDPGEALVRFLAKAASWAEKRPDVPADMAGLPVEPAA